MKRMRLARLLPALLVVFSLLLVAGTASAWIENHVLGDEVTLRVETTGEALVEHRILIHTNGNVRFRQYVLVGVERDAVPLSNSFIVPAVDALASSLESATPLRLRVVPGKADDGPEHLTEPARLEVEVVDDKGLRRGRYVMVIRYKVDLARAGRVTRDGAFTRITWHGLIFDDGFDNARTTFVVPRAPTPPRGVEELAASDAPDGVETAPAATYLAEVRRGEASDEVELLRTYAPKGEAVPWAVRVDPRALAVAINESERQGEGASEAERRHHVLVDRPVPRSRSSAVAALMLFLVIAMLAWLKACETRRLAARAAADVPPLVPLPGWTRALLAGICLTAGVAMQLAFDEAVAGAGCVVAATLFTVYRPARLDAAATMRGPGKWLTVSEREALSDLPRPSGGWLDFSTTRGKLLFGTLGGGVGYGVWHFWSTSPWHAVLLAGDAVFLLAVFGSAMGCSMPPDMTVEPARFLRKLVVRLRKRKDLGGVRIVPRIRVPAGTVDPDEVRLLISPRFPLRGFIGIEVGVTYALGLGARVAMPEVLVRVLAGSPCDVALTSVSRVGRVSPGRKREERVISFSPRFPTVKMTAEIAAAVAVRVVNRAAGSRRRPEAPREKQAA